MRSEDDTALAEVFKQHRPRVLAWLISLTGDFEGAEEAFQDAVVVALRRWPRDGVPENPAGWLAVTARNRATDQLRRNQRRVAKERSATADLAGTPVDSSPLEDERLRLIFTCCHPALSLEARVGLTLRAVAGLSTTEIAQAFLVSEPTLAQRLVRAKRKIRTARIPYEVPAPERLGERLQGVLAVLYLIFNEGYAASNGEVLIRSDLCEEAMRLARTLCTLMPSESEVRALLALMLLQDSRRDARIDAGGELILLPDQDRSRWNEAAIREGLAELDQASRHGDPGPYFIQAAIAAEHALALEAEETDWPRIVRLYGTLARMTPSPVVELNRLVAVSMAEGPELALAGLLQLQEQLDAYSYFHVTRADFLQRLGRTHDAIEAFTRALALAGSETQRASLRRRIALLRAAGSTD